MGWRHGDAPWAEGQFNDNTLEAIFKGDKVVANRRSQEKIVKPHVAIVPLICWTVIASASPAADGPQLERDAAARTVLSTEAAQPLPMGEQVIQRMLGRSAALAAVTNSPAWAYDKTQVISKLAANAKVEERTEKLYRVRIVRGVPFSRLVKVQGRELTEAQIEKENQREGVFQKGLSGRDPKKTVRERGALITKDLVERFEFKSLRREPIHGRQTVVVSFEGKPGKSDNSFQNRFLSQMAGTLWVDEETADVARLEVRLTQGFSLGMLGMRGAVKDCRMDLVSKPMADGTWLPEQTVLAFSGRIFLSNVRFRVEEASANFTLEPPSKINLP